MKRIEYPLLPLKPDLLRRPSCDNKEYEAIVKAVLEDVGRNGDRALKKYVRKFDRIRLIDFRVSEKEIEAATKKIDPALKKAIKQAAKNISIFHASQKQKAKKIQTTRGVTCWRKQVPIEKVGLYVPGGSAPLFSTLLMLGIPATVAGCKQVTVCTPCQKDGEISAPLLYTASMLGIKNIFKVGGAQAIAAMAYGTESINKVQKIFGPGNQFVTLAKQLVQQQGVAIDLPAGPSELAVIADESAKPDFVAADLLSQLEHGTDSQAILVSWNRKVLDRVSAEIKKQIQDLPRRKIANESLRKSMTFLVKDSNEAVDLINAYAPEHLIVACKESNSIAKKITNAGSVFIGNYSCESVGDYASGTNHTLPTNGYASAYSGVSLDSFMKTITFQEVTRAGLCNIGPSVEAMAEAEGLFAHKNAVTIRLKNI